MVELIDLSGMIETGQPVYPGSQRTQFWVTSTHEESGYGWSQQIDENTPATDRKLRAATEGQEEENPHIRSVLMSEHGPTHVDSFSHLDPTSDGSIDNIPLERFYTPAVGIDVSHVSPDSFITVSTLRDALGTAEVSLKDGDAITLHTGHRDRNYDVEDYSKRHAYLHDYTGLDSDAAKWLADQGVTNIGIDSPSIDHSDAMDTKRYPAHDICNKHEILNMENMANLNSVAGKRYTLCAFPLKIRNGTGSPIRPVAILD
jgi:kynurenine formamidase